VPKGVTPADGTVKPCYRRESVRFLLLLALASGCQGDGAAVGVRWEIVDLTRGVLKRPDEVGANGACGVDEGDASPLPSWVIQQVRLVVADPTTNVEVLSADDRRLLFNCSQREAITSFTLPLGTFSLSLRAVNHGADDPSVVTPAPSVRTLKSAEVVNLDVVELGIHPVMLAPSFDAGAVDLSMPDLGPVP
jgi:hypothetical protein